MKKKFLSIILAGVALMSLCACTNDTKPEHSAEEIAEMYYTPDKGDYTITIFEGDNAYRINYEDGIAYVYDQDTGTLSTYPLK